MNSERLCPSRSAAWSIRSRCRVVARMSIDTVSVGRLPWELRVSGYCIQKLIADINTKAEIRIASPSGSRQRPCAARHWRVDASTIIAAVV